MKKSDTDIKKLHENTAQLSAILEAFEGDIYVSSLDFRVKYMNSHLTRRLGKEAVGKLCYEAIHGRNSVCPFCVQNQVQAGETVRFELKNPKDGRWYYSMNAPIRHMDQSISLLAMITDIHERKKSETELRNREVILRQENIMLRSSLKERNRFGDIVGKSPPMQGIYEQILNAASTTATVIIYGEPGTGKELVAYAIHDMSERRDNRFVPVHCGAMPENLIESEFFGYKKGAFSGALHDKDGFINFADRGTLFLDEIGEVSPHMQVKLLRVLEGGGYTPVGGNQVLKSDIRIISATNRDLRERIEREKMRKDFYYRIHILPIYLPPLRERKEDIPILVDHFLILYGGKKNLSPITGNALEMLMNYDWPGNVRELQNVIIRYCHSENIELIGELAAKPVAQSDLLLGEFQTGHSKKLKTMMNVYEKKIIENALNQKQWRRNQAARLLGIDRKTLFTKMKRHGLITDEKK